MVKKVKLFEQLNFNLNLSFDPLEQINPEDLERFPPLLLSLIINGIPLDLYKVLLYFRQFAIWSDWSVDRNNNNHGHRLFSYEVEVRNK